MLVRLNCRRASKLAPVVVLVYAGDMRRVQAVDYKTRCNLDLTIYFGRTRAVPRLSSQKVIRHDFPLV
jgi:hypothetical protein